MKKIGISENWLFRNESHKTPYEQVDLPHDYQIRQKRDPALSGGNGFYPDTVGRYVKHLTLQGGKHYILNLDGAYMCAHVTFNEHQLAMHPHGYTPFLVELTKHVRPSLSNKLVIATHPLPFSSRWYSGNGLYRDVFLWEGGEVRIEPWDLFVSTEQADEEKATLLLQYDVSADEDADVSLCFAVYDGDTVLCREETDLHVTDKEKTHGTHRLTVSSPRLWSPDTPHLYTLVTTVKKNGEVTDTCENAFGIRTVSANAEQGLLLNGKPIKLRGGCIHHDHGELGAAAYPDAEERKLRILKEAGFNAVRTAHNPPSLALLEACDRLGIMVMDEAFDCWNLGKPLYDYHLFFADWWARDISYMVMRDSNHPCVFSYSTGNEILEINGTGDMAAWSRRLSDEIRKYDTTRFVTSALQKGFVRRNRPEDIDPEEYRDYVQATFRDVTDEQINAITLPYEEPLDIVGVNYYRKKYLFEHEMYPNRVLWGSETRPLFFYESWKLTEESPYILGDFTWTAYDNMGEVGAGRFGWLRNDDTGGKLSLAPYPWRNCFQGDHDLCGFRRPQSYFREELWRKNTAPRIFVTHPEHFGEPFFGTRWHWHDVEECWTFDDRYVGRPIEAEVYTTADRIVWYVNGEQVGESVPKDGIATVQTVYQTGYIRAVAYRNGEPYAEHTLETVTPACALNIRAERDTFLADGRSLCFLPITMVDAKGRHVFCEPHEITCHVLGGELLAVFSGDPKSEDDPASPSCHTFRGSALAVVRTKTPGTVTVTVCADGLAGSSVTVTAISKDE